MTALPADGDAVFVPARPVRDGAASVPAVELRRLRDAGVPVGLAFTSVDTLVAALGEYQPWLCMPMRWYVAWLRVQGVFLVQVDPLYGNDMSDWSAGRLLRTVEEM